MLLTAPVAPVALILLLFAGSLGCAKAAGPHLVVKGEFPDTDDEILFLVAAQEKEAIAESLESVGFELAENLLDAPYRLRVTLGVDRDFASCGTLNNVKYALSSADGPILQIAARGWTGDCKPNVFDVLSQRLRQAFASRPRLKDPTEVIR